LNTRAENSGVREKPSASFAARHVTGYSLAARSFHWLTALLVVAAFLLSVGGPEAHVFSVENKGLLTLHESLGLSIFVTTLVRLAHRRWTAQPDPVPMPEWMLQTARVIRVLLYFLLIFVPVSAIAGSWIEGHPLSFYFIGNVAAPWAPSQALGRTILSVHKFAGDSILWLAGLHAAAALFHHFVLRDRVLRSMLFSS
jgi:cytochrome b561